MSKKIKSPLRYPGGKSKALKIIIPKIPKEFSEFREPFVGGGSVFLELKQIFGESITYRINDLNYGVYSFWKGCRDHNIKLVSELFRIKESTPTSGGRKLYNELLNSTNCSEFEEAVRFFILNRITFSGTAESGGYSNASFKDRFTNSSIERVAMLEGFLDGVIINNHDFDKEVSCEGSDPFIFMDPPYYSQTSSKLYGKNGDLHVGFQHGRLKSQLEVSPYKWLMTYDDCSYIRDMYTFANIGEWELKYSMDNFKQEKTKKGRELFICSNYTERGYYHD